MNSELMSNDNLHVLITRPEKQGQALKNKLASIKIRSLCQPLFDYQLNDHANICQQPLLSEGHNKTAIVIFVSVAAVEFADQQKPIKLWSVKTIIAIGHATQKALLALDIKAVCPKDHDSEGVLALPELCREQIKNQPVIIVRGDGGRELIAQTLKQRQAKVVYIESYQRIWRQLSLNVGQKWQAEKINAIVVTSNAALKKLVELLVVNEASYWTKNCLWIVASQRIADCAQHYGLSNVINAYGASDDVILSTLKQLAL